MSYLALVIYIRLVRLVSLLDYWRQSDLYNLPTPSGIMSGRQFRHVSTSIHLRDPNTDAENEKKGSPAYDRLCKIKLIYHVIREASKAYFHTNQQISVDERMVASKARSGLK